MLPISKDFSTIIVTFRWIYQASWKKNLKKMLQPIVMVKQCPLHTVNSEYRQRLVGHICIFNKVHISLFKFIFFFLYTPRKTKNLRFCRQVILDLRTLAMIFFWVCIVSIFTLVESYIPKISWGEPSSPSEESGRIWFCGSCLPVDHLHVIFPKCQKPEAANKQLTS